MKPLAILIYVAGIRIDLTDDRRMNMKQNARLATRVIFRMACLAPRVVVVVDAGAAKRFRNMLDGGVTMAGNADVY